MIEVKKLTKFYGPNRAVEDVSFTVEKGQILGLLGPNGAGKTTIMRILTGYFQPTSGSATVAGFDVVEETMEVKKRIGYLQEVLPLSIMKWLSLPIWNLLPNLKACQKTTGKNRSAKPWNLQEQTMFPTG